MTDLLHIVSEGTINVGDHRIVISTNDEGRLQYQVGHVYGATYEHEEAFDDFQEALAHALANLVHLLEEQYPDQDDDSIEGPGADKEIARNLLERLSENQGLIIEDLLAEAKDAPLTRTTTLYGLYATLGKILSEGKDSSAPVRLRTRDGALIAYLDSVTFDEAEGILYLHEAGA